MWEKKRLLSNSVRIIRNVNIKVLRFVFLLNYFWCLEDFCSFVNEMKRRMGIELGQNLSILFYLISFILFIWAGIFTFNLTLSIYFFYFLRFSWILSHFFFTFSILRSKTNMYTHTHVCVCVCVCVCSVMFDSLLPRGL